MQYSLLCEEKAPKYNKKTIEYKIKYLHEIYHSIYLKVVNNINKWEDEECIYFDKLIIYIYDEEAELIDTYNLDLDKKILLHKNYLEWLR